MLRRLGFAAKIERHDQMLANRRFAERVVWAHPAGIVRCREYAAHYRAICL